MVWEFFIIYVTKIKFKKFGQEHNLATFCIRILLFWYELWDTSIICDLLL